MRAFRGPVAPALAVVLLTTAAAASGGAVVVRVQPTKTLAGERITVSARVTGSARSCSARITRPGARAAALPAQRPRRRAVAWPWTVPVSARSGVGSAQVTCGRAGSGRGRFTIQGLPAGEPAAGKTVFLLNCGGCHTLADAGTQGTSIDLDLAKPTFERTIDRAVNGKGLMPSFRTRLTPQEIANVATYVSSAAGG